MRKVKQFRYYGANNSDLNNIKAEELTIGQGVITPEYSPVIQLGIQSAPGVKFYLNNSKKDPIIIGSTGIYELNVENMVNITTLLFDKVSIDMIDNSPSSVYLIIDILYDN